MSKLCYLVKKNNLVPLDTPYVYKADISSSDIAVAGVKLAEQAQIRKPLPVNKKRFFSGALDNFHRAWPFRFLCYTIFFGDNVWLQL